ncbi:MAG: flagellar filament capping protein FliD [Bryobacteraceae bacterium]|nr:flagellar filament capping protein FliD [Bryobacteraceae bacterium]MDW8379072.1 flagellar filament capping protein FliD [Bryobacterales bacterium]
MNLTPLTFTGVSSFSEDFQTILNRATQIANLPVKALQNQQKDLLEQKLLVSNLSSAVGALATSLSNLGATSSQKALLATSSDSTKLTAMNINASSPAVYTISNVTSLAKSAAETTLSGYQSATSTPVSSTGLLTLRVGSSSYAINITGQNNLTALRDKINQANAGVTASILTTGTGSNPYYLSITANQAGATTLELRDDPSGANINLLTTNNQGADTEFQLNGVTIRKRSNTIHDVVPGLKFNILKTTSAGETITITLATDRTQIARQLEDLVQNYNTVREFLNGQIGSAAGLLSGDFLIRETMDRLRALTSYSGTGSIRSLADLGIEFDSKGMASFQRTKFDSLSESQLEDVFTFLGTEQTGLGGFGAQLRQISDSVTGLAQLQIQKYDETQKRLEQQITILSSRIEEMKKTLSAKLQAADTILASLQSQKRVLDASLQSLNYTLYGRKEN